MSNIKYLEPKRLITAGQVIADIVLCSSAQQYGGFTLPEIDKTLSKYAKYSKNIYVKEYEDLFNEEGLDITEPRLKEKINRLANQKVEKDMDSTVQTLEMRFNTVGSSRGDYPFVTVTFGLGTDEFSRMASKSLMKVRKEGQGREKRPVLFPKLVFLYDENLHGPGKINNDVFEEGIDCSSKCMYPDFLSLTGDGYVPDMYKKYGTVVSPMGCRAFLSPYYEKGGQHAEDEHDKAIFVGRWNAGRR